MSELTIHADSHLLLDAIAQAYADGDASRGDLLFEQALDTDLSWTEICSAAARGVSRHYAEQRHA